MRVIRLMNHPVLVVWAYATLKQSHRLAYFLLVMLIFVNNCNLIINFQMGNPLAEPSQLVNF